MQAEGDDDRMAVDRPRDLKQVSNYSHTSRQETKISRNELFSLHEQANQLEGVIHATETFTSLCVIFALPEALSLGKQLVQISISDRDLCQLIAVDTTFQLGDFYVTCMHFVEAC